MTIDRTASLHAGPLIPEVCQGPGEPGLVSVLIPTFNRAYILGQALDSVLAQTYRQFEVVVVDDGSTDGTDALVAGYVARWGDRVRYIHQPNAGLAAARNTGLAAARGEFLAFQDSDDLWAPWKLDAQLALMRQQPGLVLVWTDMTAVSPAGAVVQEQFLRTMYHAYREVDVDAHMARRAALGAVWPDSPDALRGATCRWGDIYSAMYMGNLVHPPTALMRRDAVRKAGGLDQAFAWTCEDYEFFWRVSRQGPAGLIEAPGMLYRVDAADQLTKPQLQLFVARGNMLALQQALRWRERRVELPREQMRQHLMKSHRWLAEAELFAPGGRRWTAVKSFAAVLRHLPWERRMVMLMLAALALPRPLVAWLRAAKTGLALD